MGTQNMNTEHEHDTDDIEIPGADDGHEPPIGPVDTDLSAAIWAAECRKNGLRPDMTPL
jgi:hypothetical protein